MSDSARWFHRWPARMPALVDVILCPGAGAGASVFRAWPDLLPGFAAIWGLQLPGRESRMSEMPGGDLTAMALAAADAFLDLRAGRRPLVLFGHSMGGTIAVEIARALIDAEVTIAGAILAASAPPRGNPVQEPLSDEAVIRLLAAYAPDEKGVETEQDLLMTLVPIVRQDIEMLRTHRVDPLPALSAHLFAAATDPLLAQSECARWKILLGKDTTLSVQTGGHFTALREGRADVLDRLSDIVNQAIGR